MKFTKKLKRMDAGVVEAIVQNLVMDVSQTHILKQPSTFRLVTVMEKEQLKHLEMLLRRGNDSFSGSKAAAVPEDELPPNSGKNERNGEQGVDLRIRVESIKIQNHGFLSASHS